MDENSTVILGIQNQISVIKHYVQDAKCLQVQVSSFPKLAHMKANYLVAHLKGSGGRASKKNSFLQEKNPLDKSSNTSAKELLFLLQFMNHIMDSLLNRRENNNNKNAPFNPKFLVIYMNPFSAFILLQINSLVKLATTVSYCLNQWSLLF